MNRIKVNGRDKSEGRDATGDAGHGTLTIGLKVIRDEEWKEEDEGTGIKGTYTPLSSKAALISSKSISLKSGLADCLINSSSYSR